MRDVTKALATHDHMTTLNPADLAAAAAIVQVHGTHATGLDARLLTAAHQQGGPECHPDNERPAEDENGGSDE